MKEVGDTLCDGEQKEKVNKLQKKKRDEKKQRAENIDCRYCGKIHERKKEKGSAFGETCSKCKIRNHFSKMCRSKQQNYKRVKEIDDDSDSSDFVLAVTSDKKNLKSEFYMRTDGSQFVRTECMLDTGATCNIIGKRNLKRLFQFRDVIVKKTSTRLKSFGGSVIQPIGKIIVECKRKKECFPIEFEIVEHDHIPLLSAKTCEDMGFIKISSTIRQLNDATKDANDIVNEFSDVFEGLGCFAGKVKLEVYENAMPVVQKPRRIATAFNKELKAQLDEMERKGVIQKESEHTEWVSNILFVKRNNKSRICLDPCELNKALKCVKYPIPTIDEILPELNQAKVFSTVDAKKGFWQIQLDEPSSKMCTFFTPYGRYRFVRMPFRIGPAMEIYQMKQNEILHGLDGIAVIADDVLIFRKGKTIEEATDDHNKNLRNLFKRLREKLQAEQRKIEAVPA